MQGTGVTKAEIETIKSNLAFVFSNGKNIFYEKGILGEYQIRSHTYVNFYQMIDVLNLSKMPHQNYLM